MATDDDQPKDDAHHHPPTVFPIIGPSAAGSETDIPTVEPEERDVSADLVAGRRRKHDHESTGSEKDSEMTLQEEADGIPYDGGWGWTVALGVFVNYVLLMGYLKSSGLFFVELLQKFQAPASRTALLFAIRNGVFCLCGFFVMNVLVGRFEVRRLVLLGGTLMALSAILSSFANQLTLLICLQAGLLAVGQSMLTSPGQVLVGQYFKKWRNLALAFTECGVSVGNITVPLLVSYFLEQYALQGTLLLYGGLCLHSLPAAMLHRPLSFYSQRRSRQRPEQKKVFLEDAATDPDTASNHNGTEQDGSGLVADDRDDRSSSDECVNPEDQRCVVELGGSEPMSPTSAETQNLSGNESQESSQDVDQEALSGSTQCLQETESPNQNCCGRFLNCSFFSLLNFSLFQDSMFRVFIVYASICAFVNIPVDYLPALVSQRDIGESQAAKLLSTIGGLDLACRITCGVIAGSNKVRVSTVVLISYVILAVVMQFVRYMETWEHFLVLAVVLGLLGSVGNCLFPQLVIELVGVDRMGQAIGWSQLGTGIVMTPVYPLLGYVHDLTGSYVLVYHIIGMGLMASAAALCFVRPVRHCRERNHRARDQPEENTHL